MPISHSLEKHWFLQLQDAESSLLSTLGGKASSLAKMLQGDLPVPPASVLLRLPENDEEWNEVIAWWDKIGRPPLAIRSSALGEDSSGQSFAGQFQTYLQVSSEKEIQRAVQGSLASVQSQTVQAYHEVTGTKPSRMNVVLQQMVQPQFSGVYFTHDPRGGSHFLVEFVRGLGEQLVSGKVTPFRFSAGASSQDLPSDFSVLDRDNILKGCRAAEACLGGHLDIEWAIDQDKRFWLLQARPITTRAVDEEAREKIQLEISRMASRYDPDSVWDSQTFADWPRVCTQATFSVWQQAFAPEYAFEQSLRSLGYKGFDQAREASPLLERFFGRLYMNLDELNRLHFGPIPYKIQTTPYPHLEFDASRIDVQTVLQTPFTIGRMIRAGWNLQTHRQEYLKQAEQALTETESTIRQDYAGLSFQNLQKCLEQWVDRFSRCDMVWPFTVIALGEATYAGLFKILSHDLGVDKANQLISQILATETVTGDMLKALQSAGSDREAQQEFLQNYGYRGFGEMDLANPRWWELGESAFGSGPTPDRTSTTNSGIEIFAQIAAVRRSLALEEAEMMKRILRIRERWKMKIMRNYNEIRQVYLEFGRRLQLETQVFHLSVQEILQLSERCDKDEWLRVCQDRKICLQAYARMRLPGRFAIKDLESLFSQNPEVRDNQLQGIGIAPGVVYGKVKIVRDPSDFNLNTQENLENIILVAESTDPGWTPLFQKSSGIIVERGGVLSHCAILARELGVPAISGISQATDFLKNNSYIWMDGSNGRITLAGDNRN